MFACVFFVAQFVRVSAIASLRCRTRRIISSQNRLQFACFLIEPLCVCQPNCISDVACGTVSLRLSNVAKVSNNARQETLNIIFRSQTGFDKIIFGISVARPIQLVRQPRVCGFLRPFTFRIGKRLCVFSQSSTAFRCIGIRTISTRNWEGTDENQRVSFEISRFICLDLCVAAVWPCSNERQSTKKKKT